MIDQAGAEQEAAQRPVKWGKVIDNRLCIACHACTVACKAEHEVPLGVTRTYVKMVEVGEFPEVRRHFQVTRCNQCEDAPCVEACPTSAMFQRPDGIVDFDRDICIGCSACIAACPYDAIYINPEHHSAEKCNFCAHRIDQQLEPACVSVCPTQAIIVGDLNDPASSVSRLIARNKVDVRRPEKGTEPKLFYVDATPFTLVPGAAKQGSLQMATQARGGPSQSEDRHTSGVPAAAALLGYDNAHKAPWDWRVSAYTWTKSLAAGIFLVFALFRLADEPLGRWWEIMAASSAMAFLGLTGAILIAHLSHPGRFYLILLRPQWRSWLARGAFIVVAYGAVLVVVLLLSVLKAGRAIDPLLGLTVPFAVLTAIYTAFLLGQSRGRDLWQNPLLPAHFGVQAALAGLAVLYITATLKDADAGLTAHLAWGLTATLAANVVLVLAELTMPHPTEMAAQAARNLVRGPYRFWYWGGLAIGGLLPLALVSSGLAADIEQPLQAAAVMTLLGLFAQEHGYVQAGQSVPLS